MFFYSLLISLYIYKEKYSEKRHDIGDIQKYSEKILTKVFKEYNIILTVPRILQVIDILFLNSYGSSTSL